jgi:hypothetical protein
MLRYIQRRTCMKFIGTHGVYLCKKPKQTHRGPHNRDWYSSWAMMSFMAGRVSILFMCALEIWGSAEGVTGMTQYTIVAETLNLAQISLLVAFFEVWRILILFCRGGLAYTWQWRFGYIPQSTIFHIYCQSRKCYVWQSCLMLHYQWRTGTCCIHSLTICKGKYPFLIGIDNFLSVYRQSFICITFLLKNYLDFRHVVHYQ